MCVRSHLEAVFLAPLSTSETRDHQLPGMIQRKPPLPPLLLMMPFHIRALYFFLLYLLGVAANGSEQANRIIWHHT